MLSNASTIPSPTAAALESPVPVEPNQDFVPELERRLKEMGLGKETTIILICRSGDRSSKAQDRLQVAGYNKVFGIAEGFEGDTAKGGTKDGQRAVNGWKNANLPWTYVSTRQTHLARVLQSEAASARRHRCGSNSPIRLCGCVGRRVRTSFR